MTSDNVIQLRDHRTAGQSDLTDSVMDGTLEGETTGLIPNPPLVPNKPHATF